MMRILFPLLCSLALVGCASFDQREIAAVRARGVSERVVHKLDHGRPVEPRDLVELTRRGVPSEWIIRQLEDHGVTSMITRADVLVLRRGGVRPEVIDALLRASDRFAERYATPDLYLDEHYDTLGFVEPYPYPVHGSVGVGFSISGHHRHHRRF
ncbi:MAG TPA: hypothetical protein VF593_11880 [Chthoniobacteraceae bacterium]|jgi:hypothetical protein